MGRQSAPESIYTGILERAAAGASSASAAMFAALSALRGKRFFHPDGDTYEGTATFVDTEFELPLEGSSKALVRLSRGAGVPGALPDVLGLGIKFPKFNHDLLLATSGDDPVTRHLLLPALGFFSRPFSSVLPYQLNGRLIVFGARADTALKDANTADPAEVRPLVATGKLRFELTVADVGSGQPQTFASLVVDRDHEGDIRFNPWNCIHPLRPAGPLNRLRLQTYKASQSARPS